MAESKLSKQICLALDHLPQLTDQLKEAGYDICDGEGVWSFRDDPPGYWAADFQPDEYGHQMLVVSIHSTSDADWGISYAATLCGECRGTCYWSGKTRTLLGSEHTWPDLSVAVLKARSLLHLEQESQADG